MNSPTAPTPIDLVPIVPEWLRRHALLLWLGVLAIALLSCYVHVVNNQVLRGHLLHQSQRASALKVAKTDRRPVTVAQESRR